MVISKHFLIGVVLFLFTTSISAQIPPVNAKYKYEFKIAAVTDIYSFKEIRFYLEGMFDAIPVLNDDTDEIFVESDVEVDDKKFADKMKNLGHTSVYFRINYTK